MKNFRIGKEASDRKRRFFAALVLVLASQCIAFAGNAADTGFYLEVPYVRQRGNYCGPSALAMVLRFWGLPADQYELAESFRPFPPRGLSGTQLKELAANHRLVAHSFSGSSEIIRDHVSKGRPLILALSSSRLLNRNHYVVLVGWDSRKRDWIVHDPADGPYRRLSEKKLLERWTRLENWTLLVLPEGRN